MKHVAAMLSLVLLAAGCTRTGTMYRPGEVKLEQVAQSSAQWTSVAVTPGGRIFVNYPRWSDSVPLSVAKLESGVATAFPGPSWNDWAPGKDPSRKWVCVQSVVADDWGRLWVLDAGNPKFAGVVPGAPKLVCIDPATHAVLATYAFEQSVLKPGSYLNDVRFDPQRNHAYLTDSGAGALVVLNLKTGQARRVLEESRAVKPEPIDVVINGQPWRMDGAKRDVAADGITLSRDGTFVYFHALTGRTLYRIRAQWLVDARITPSQLSDLVETVEVDRPCDGMQSDARGHLYLTSIEENAISLVSSRLDAAGREKFTRQTLVQSPRLEWPDSMAWDERGYLYVTTSRIAQKDAAPGPYRLYRLVPAR